MSDETPCWDHNIAWLVRHNLSLDHLASSPTKPGVVGPAMLFAGDFQHPDNIIYDIMPNPNGGPPVSVSGFGHPTVRWGPIRPRFLRFSPDPVAQFASITIAGIGPHTKVAVYVCGRSGVFGRRTPDFLLCLAESNRFSGGRMKSAR